MAKALLFDVIEDYSYHFPLVQVNQWVDDLSAYRAAFPSLFSLLELRPKDEDYTVEEAFPPASFAGADDAGWGPAAAALRAASALVAQLRALLAPSAQLGVIICQALPKRRMTVGNGE